MVFDPFAYIDEESTEEVIQVDEEMFTVEVGGKIFGVDEGLLLGMVIGFIVTSIYGK